jgi:alpha-N-arabinofuranosidase
MENSSRTIRIDRDKAGAEISPFLFGHNLEHTRKAMWKGLSAQLLANRKFAGAVSVRSPDNKTELVKNPVGPDGVANGWFGFGQPHTTFAHDSHVGYAGNESQKISVTQPEKSGGIGQRDIPLKGGVPHTLRLYLKSETAIRGQIRFSDPSGKKTYASQAFNVDGGGWQDWQHTFVPTNTDEHGTLEISFQGPCTVWVGVASLLPDDNFLGLRRDVVDLLKEMSVPMLRWPGGNFTLDYRWQDGLLPVDQRPTIRGSMSEVLPFTNSCDFHEIGIDEFIALCRHLNAEPFLTANLRPQDIGTAEDAAAWVEYCNGSVETKWGSVRGKRGHPEPYRVKYWSIGNEIWGAHMLQTHCDAQTYARQVCEYAPAMRKADSSIILTAVGIPAPVWDAIVVSEAGQHFDLLSGHEYVKPEGHDSASYTRLSDAASIHFLEQLKTCRKLVN